MTSVDLSIIIVSFNTRDLTRECLQIVARESADLAVEVIIVDNASRDGSGDMIASEFPDVTLIRSEVNLGFGNANNLAYEQARGRYIVLLNTDAFLGEGVLQESIALMDANPDVAIGGGPQTDRDGTIQPSARHFPTPLTDFYVLTGLAARYPHSRMFGWYDRTCEDPESADDVDWMVGAFLVIRRSALDQGGGLFDPRFFLYHEEVDLCWRVKEQGWRVRYWPELRVVHLGGESSKTLQHLSLSSFGAQITKWRMRSQFLFYRKNRGLLATWLSWKLEAWWHVLRLLKQRLVPGANAAAKSEESRATVVLLREAWTETQGGRVSPPQPW